MNYDEPIPPFITRYTGRLEACLSLPFQTYGGKSLYSRFPKKAAVLFYGVIKDHPFLNGNKRMAVMLTLTFCYVNHRWAQVKPDDLYMVACDVAASGPKDRDQMIERLRKFFAAAMTAI